MEKKKRITLTSKEISELLAEGIVTVILLLLLNVAVVVVLSTIIENSPTWNDAIYDTKNFLFNHVFRADIFWSGSYLIVPFFGIVDLIILYWRLIRRQ